jgi:hypothetical protein
LAREYDCKSTAAIIHLGMFGYLLRSSQRI